jgi:large subunit ribosomal protein L10
MPTADKERTIELAKEWYGKSSGIVFADYRGLKVKELQELRANLRTKGGELHVLKNTLFRIAAGDDTAKLPADLHNGTTAFAFVYENESQVAKALLDYARTSKKLVVKGGFFGGKAFTSKEVEALAELPPKEVLISQVIGLIASPLSDLVGVIEALYADPIRTIGAVADKVAEGSPVPEAESAEPPAASESDAAESNSPEVPTSPETSEASETTENA